MVANEHVRATGLVKKSERAFLTMADSFAAKIPGYLMCDVLELYEVVFQSANVTVDMENSGIVKL